MFSTLPIDLEDVETLDLLQFQPGSLTATAVMQFAHISDIMTIIRENERKTLLSSAIDLKALQAGAMTKYQAFQRAQTEAKHGSTAIDWDDLRIREFTEKEVKDNHAYMTFSANAARLHDVDQVCVCTLLVCSPQCEISDKLCNAGHH